MAFLGKGKKVDLVNLALELDVEVSSEMKLPEIKRAILGSADYDEEFVKNMFQIVIASRKDEEEREKETEMREFRLKEQELERDTRLKEKELELKYELERCRVESEIHSSGTNETVSTANSRIGSRVDMRKLMPNFDPEVSDISLYLVIFERQISRAEVPKENWVGQLLSVLPLEIVQLIAREPDDLAEDYEYIKKLLLKRYKLSPEAFRRRFMGHVRKPDATWKDFTFEIRNYLEEWLMGLEISSLEELKDLLVVDQLKRRALPEMREHFLDDWANYKSASQLAEIFDGYEMVRPRKHNFEKRKKIEGPDSVPTEEKVRFGNKPRTNFPPRETGNRGFGRRDPLLCYACGKSGHLKAVCPATVERDSFEVIQNVRAVGKDRLLTPYSSNGKVNGQSIQVLRDTGATIDLIPRRFVHKSALKGEKVWIKQPLSAKLICLPLADIELSGEFGAIKTKVAVCGNHVDLDRYLLGNRTAELIRDKYKREILEIEPVKAVKARSQTRDQSKGKRVAFDRNHVREDFDEEIESKGRDFAINLDSEGKEKFPVPEPLPDIPGLDLVKIEKRELIKAQRDSPDLKILFEQACGKKGSYSIENGVLFKTQQNRMGHLNKLVVIPEGLRNPVKEWCHNGTAIHFGSTKSKERLNRYFYWPHCYRDIGNFVHTCNLCRKAGKPSDRSFRKLKEIESGKVVLQARDFRRESDVQPSRRTYVRGLLTSQVKDRGKKRISSNRNFGCK